jgi:phosphoribosylaminoimidazolecarboxamide formyltransferase/IMP cyclohydrolase
LKEIKSALISVFDKSNLEPILEILKEKNVSIYSTGGTRAFIESQGIDVIPVEDITEYPSILGGRVKTLHPKVFGGILSRRDYDQDETELATYEIPKIDLVIVDLYPFEETLKSGAPHDEIIEKIDIGGISLIRAAAKNYKDVVIVPSKNEYNFLSDILTKNNGSTSIEERKHLAGKSFVISSNYDNSIQGYFNDSKPSTLKLGEGQNLRYGENPHQKGIFFGDLKQIFDKLHGKELSYNNLLDVDAAVSIMNEFDDSQPAFAILKHNNACGMAVRSSLAEAYVDALAGDPVSAFGGILICNKTMDIETASKINELFCEVVIAPEYNEEALRILQSKKNRIILKQKSNEISKDQIRTILNGYLWQDKDIRTDKEEDLKNATKRTPSDSEINDLIFASKLCKNTKSNTIILAKNNQLFAGGTGQTSRVDALNQAIEKAQNFGFDLNGAVMASDAFFPFPDCVEIANKVGIKAVIQPGGSIKDQLSIDFCNANEMAMVFTGTRHFKH